MSLALPAVRRRRIALAALALAAAAVPRPGGAQARPVTVIGFVSDTAAAPVPAAEVLVEGTPILARTDDQGAFRLDGLRAGTFVLTVRRLGFRARSDRFEARAGDTLQLVMDLVAMPAALAEVTVTERRTPQRRRWLDEFESRRGRGFGTFVTRDDIVKRAPMHTSDLFRTISGVSVVSARGGSELRMLRSRTCAPDIYIDGLEAQGFRIDDIPPTDIAGIEVFRGPAETPPRFRREHALCGVVSIWTREPGRS